MKFSEKVCIWNMKPQCRTYNNAYIENGMDWCFLRQSFHCNRKLRHELLLKSYLGLAEQSKPSLYAGSISKPIPFLLSVKGAVPNISKIAQHKTLHVLM